MEAFCAGKVRGQGSLNYYGMRANGTAIIRGTDEQYAWRDEVTAAVRAANTEDLHATNDVAIAVDMLFVYARPKSHYRSNGELKENMPHWILNNAGIDVDKSARLVNDALTNSGLIADDKHIALMRGEKIYVNDEHDTPGVHIKVWAM